MKYSIVFILTTLSFISCTRCTLHAPNLGKSLSILSYNVENLFDDRDDGTEYREYDPGEGTWDSLLYHAKLENISQAIEASVKGGPDICLLQEVENKRVVEDLRNGYLSILKYRYSFTATSPQTATTVAVLSRYAPELIYVHRLYAGDDYTLRNILEMEFDVRGGSIVVLNNHWKSKSGGAEETEPCRLIAAAFVRSRVGELVKEKPDSCIVVAGDMNERETEYEANAKTYQTALLLDGYAATDHFADKSLFLTDSWEKAGYTDGRAVFFSPWLVEDEPGSYVYNGEWERIDHFLLMGGNGGFSYHGFEVIKRDFLLDSAGRPQRWNSSSATGHSDHLPLLIHLRR